MVIPDTDVMRELIENAVQRGLALRPELATVFPEQFQRSQLMSLLKKPRDATLDELHASTAPIIDPDSLPQGVAILYHYWPALPAEHALSGAAFLGPARIEGVQSEVFGPGLINHEQSRQLNALGLKGWRGKWLSDVCPFKTDVYQRG